MRAGPSNLVPPRADQRPPLPGIREARPDMRAVSANLGAEAVRSLRPPLTKEEELGVRVTLLFQPAADSGHSPAELSAGAGVEDVRPLLVLLDELFPSHREALLFCVHKPERHAELPVCLPAHIVSNQPGQRSQGGRVLPHPPGLRPACDPRQRGQAGPTRPARPELLVEPPPLPERLNLHGGFEGASFVFLVPPKKKG